jgi:L-lactate dehydrogenase complex protein LldG
MHSVKTTHAREQILARIRKGLSNGSFPLPFPEVEKEKLEVVYAKSDLSKEELFASEFIKLGGKFVFCDTEKELADNIHLLYENKNWKEVLCSDKNLVRILFENKVDFIHAINPENSSADACITDCELLVARTGSAVFSSKQSFGRVAPVYYPVHIIVAYVSQIVEDIADAIRFMKEKYGNDLPSMINFNSGPSRTADIEKTLVVGVHGPGEVYCFLIND